MRISKLLLLVLTVFISSCNSQTSNPPEIAVPLDTSIQIKTPAVLTIKGDMENGRKLFKMNCRACHALSDQKTVGPGMKNVFTRVPQPAEEWIKKYIYNTAKVRNGGDAYAIQLHREYNGSPMFAFENVLSEQEVNDIIYFLYNNVSTGHEKEY